MVFITMSAFRDPRVDLFAVAVCLKLGGVDVLDVLVVLMGVAVCLKVGRVDVLEESDASLRRAFFFVLFVGAS